MHKCWASDTFWETAQVNSRHVYSVDVEARLRRLFVRYEKVHLFRSCLGWPLMLGLTGIPAVIELLLLPFFPESPRYMLIQRGDKKTAKKGKKPPKLLQD